MSTVDRRGFLQCIVVTATFAAGCSSEEEEAKAIRPLPVEDGRAFFPQSVASGDPRADRVILWTRLEDVAARDEDLVLTLEVSATNDFATLVIAEPGLTAGSRSDGALKVRLLGLPSATTFYYRFVYVKGGKRLASQTGRTRTAPAADDARPVRFAIASCQDFVGRYYHAWQHLLDLDPDLDAIVFLGDYVYETTGDADFQAKSGARKITFSDPASAITLSEGNLAAKSLSNYRDLYKQFRSDPVLRQVHERWPLVLTWDDHEFSDDSWGATATYSDGRRVELDVERKRNAERAFFEFTAIDDVFVTEPEGVAGTRARTIDAEVTPVFPATTIFRDFSYGKNVRLVVTDYRTNRPDHLIPEDAFPATIILDAAGMTEAGFEGTFKSDSFAYVNIDDEAFAGEKFILTQAVKTLAVQAGLSEADASARAERDVTGNLALVYVNAVLTNPAVGSTAIPPADKPRGMAWVHFGKRDLYGIRGTRYIVLKDTFDAWSAFQFRKSGGKSEDVYGSAQDAWLEGQLASAEPWKVVVSSVSMTQMIFDFRAKTDIPDTSLQNRFYADTDGWDGFPNKKQTILHAAAKSPKALFVSGDIHASFVSTEESVPCITTPAITTATFQELVRTNVKAAGFDEANPVFQYAVTEIDKSFQAGNAGIAYANSTHNGFAILELTSPAAALVTFHLVPGDQVLQPYDKAADVKAKFVELKFKIDGSNITAG